MDEKFNNLINIMKNEKMTEDEKASMSFKVNTFIQNNPVTIPIKTPYFSKFNLAHAGKIFATGLLLMVIGTGGLSYSSASALPGDLLYPIKINFNEKIEEKLASTPEQKIALRQKRIETRFFEVETLIKDEKITPENNSVVQEAEIQINKEKESLVNDLVKVQVKDPQMASLVKLNTENSIRNHKEKINTLINNRKENIKLLKNKENKKLENSDIQIRKVEQKLNKEIPLNLIKTEVQNTDNQNIEIPVERANLLIQDVKIISNTVDDSSVSSEEIDSSTTDSQESD